jgi:hypothetical protein
VPDQLAEVDAVTLDGAGHGTVTLQPPGYRMWRITTINVRTDQAPTATPVPRCTVYLGGVGGLIIAQTWMGSGATATGDLTVQPSMPVVIEWTGGVPGSRATVYLYGTMDMR